MLTDWLVSESSVTFAITGADVSDDNSAFAAPGVGVKFRNGPVPSGNLPCETFACELV